MAAKNPLNDPAVPDGAVEGINPADANAYKGFNFDMGTMNHNITCNSCHAGGGAAQFGREDKPLDEVLKERLGDSDFEALASNKDWFIHDDTLIAKVGIDGDLLGYSDYEVGAGYIGKPGVFNFKRSGVNDTDCFMCHADASQKDKTVHTQLGVADVYPIMPANPRVMVFKGVTDEGETIVISLGVPPKVGETINGKTVAKVESAYYNSVPLEVLKAVYGVDDTFINDVIRNGTEAKPFILYPNNANGATREVARVVYFEHPETTKDKDGGEPYVGGGAALLKDKDGNVVYRTFAGFFFKYISTASLMGVDTDQDGVPLAYVRFVKDGDIWKPEVYYDADEFNDKGEVELPILQNREEETYTYSVPTSSGTADNPYPQMTNGTKNREWGFVCSYCHMAIVYPSAEVDTNGDNVKDTTYYTWVTRKGTLGLAAEIVKRGDVFSYDIHRGGEDKGNLQATDLQGYDLADPVQKQQAFSKMQKAKSVISFDDVPIGYDVHFDSEKGGMTCLSCHGEGTLTEEEKELHPVHHDFLKGNDWGGHWDQSLDYNPSLKTCVDCHFGGSRELAAQVHQEKFGPEGNAAIHMEKIACEVCHIPYRTHWTFRAFYDVLGYSYNFDNRMLYYKENENNSVQFLPIDMFSPGFGPFMPIAGYGAPQPFPIAKTANGKDVVVPIYKVDFDPRQAALRLERTQFGIWKVPQESFPWGWATVIINNGFRPDEPGGQRFIYRIADPLTLVTWYDKSTGKVLYTREINAALSGEVTSEAASSGILPAGQSDKKVPAYYWENNKVCVKTILGDPICDDNGDFMPEIDTDTEYDAMKRAITEVLKAEGVKNPDPVFYIWTAPFSIDHGVLPKEYALGANEKSINGEELSCSACHDARNGRLPQANMGDIEGDETLSSLIVKNSDGTIKYFGLGREIVTVPVKIPPKAYREAVEAHTLVFFNSPENEEGEPIYGTMSWGGKNYEVMIRHAGDFLVNALSNGLDIDRHLVPIPVESSGIDGIAFAVPATAPEEWKNKKWSMKFEGVPVEVETEVLPEGEMPRRAIVVRLKNELPELLGFEHLADEIVDAGEREGVEAVFTPVILSHYIEKLEFKLSDLGVASIDDLYLNYAEIVKVRHSEGEKVSYEVDKDSFNPESITMREAINRGWASYDSYSKTLTLNVAAIRADSRATGEGELAVAILRNITPTAGSEAETPTGGGGGGCSVTPAASPASGAFNLGVLFSGLLGLFGFRRKKKQ
ncbi:hypothetical protein [Phorcysia thermohydrogeniphila]|uniref:Uncharacterized protein n=1 Tax=Phorcysia thermohydrogeniphila TaxID=936138 RepID=A0A4R1GCU2_9BACT|nr:hypothetical protein [Phorcysia thermohydrogeniphila]TCK04633.1 hypothetical protein CLV27_1066 [Phorcysia thermohydrogeniphila]